MEDGVMWSQGGGIAGPCDAIQHYRLAGMKDGAVVVFTDADGAPLTKPMFVADLLRHLDVHYEIAEPESGWRKIESFAEVEARKLRPIAETLAMLSGNAFFGATFEDRNGKTRDWYEMYLPEASALYEANGGDGGWAGEASIAKPA